MSINLKKRMTTGPATAFVSCVNLPQQERDITMQEARMITGGNTDIVGDEYRKRGWTPPPTMNGGGVSPRGGGGRGRGTGGVKAIGKLVKSLTSSSRGSGGESISELAVPHNDDDGVFREFVTTRQDNTGTGN